ncbi:SC35-like splicing factor SCL30a, 30a kd [Linnemannia elongata]|uniref:RNA-binding domain-containing protein n=1 Tax=Linnemannia elongata AG-77 TaxID=1314771 RepID=A0A197JPW0_9FUNG|nr:SC35-like splicing factor SCL30a, 30a kd [Linnemannia elongata]OAQ27302.1 RNA-binding domain-containing protein [Linnemannia elongata AG-77]
MPPRDRQNDAISLYVSGFKDTTRPSDLATLFEPHGRIADVYIPKDYYSGLPRGFAYIQYHDEEDARRVFESGEQFILDGRKLALQYAQGRRKSPNQMRGNGGRGGGGGGGDRRRSRSADRHYRPSSRRYSRSRSPSRDRRDRRRDSRSPRRRRSYSRSRSRSPRSRSRSRSRSSRRRSPSPRGRGNRRSPSPRRRSPSPRRRSPSPRRRSPSPRDRSPPRGGSPGDRRPSLKNEGPFDGSNGAHPEHGRMDIDIKNDY